ncbi:PadR family transcriptional regulator [Sediminihabitans luteus]|uniref:PadR family transcriptional regulator n=1 Tax=Sediminihabitans luteus TaxID=1138585 RepID=A0A2M9CQS9_9CELL|nr:helix-turn-helix transcriptional regulator [Sediminihabitans luteus]PJJ74191.1 PadR family transcriptional regulator [Sediminihabitans luteus]GII99044.1 hypothetical protein Slu03_14220 [Sediminihabitans luteus]
MGTYLRSTPALCDVLKALLESTDGLWGLRISVLTGRPTGTVYPLLERLERERLVESRWDLDGDRPGPPRRLYQLTATGHEWARKKTTDGCR